MSTWKEVGFIAKRTKDGWMYILPSFVDMSISTMIKDQHWVEDPITVYEHCEKHGIDIRVFSPSKVFAPILGSKRLRIEKKKEECTLDPIVTKKEKNTKIKVKIVKSKKKIEIVKAHDNDEIGMNIMNIYML